MPNLQVIDKYTESGANIPALRIVQAAELVSSDGQSYEKGPQSDLFGALVDQTERFPLKFGGLVGCTVLESRLFVGQMGEHLVLQVTEVGLFDSKSVAVQRFESLCIGVQDSLPD